MTLPTPGGTAEDSNIYVQYSPMSVFPYNTLCMAHALIKMADINTGGQDVSRPSIRLNGKAFELTTRESPRPGSLTLLLQLPLREGPCNTEALGRTSFLPDGHSMLYASMNRSNACCKMPS